jgi:cytosine/uracil/thiamine/allantoin permease
MTDSLSLFLDCPLTRRHQKVYYTQIGRSSDLLLSLNAFPSDLIATVAKGLFSTFIELTAAGTVADFHGIPFSSLSEMSFGQEPNASQI